MEDEVSCVERGEGTWEVRCGDGAVPVCVPRRDSQIQGIAPGGGEVDSRDYFEDRAQRSLQCAASTDDVLIEQIYGVYQSVVGKLEVYNLCLEQQAATPTTTITCIDPTEDIEAAAAEIDLLLNRMRDRIRVSGVTNLVNPPNGAPGAVNIDIGKLEAARAFSQIAEDPNSFECVTDTQVIIIKDEANSPPGCVCTIHDNVEGCAEGEGEECSYDFIQEPNPDGELSISQELIELQFNTPTCEFTNRAETLDADRDALTDPESASNYANSNAKIDNNLVTTFSNNQAQLDANSFSTLELESSCTEAIHLFPGGPGSDLEDLGVYTGDGTFSQAEEEFWGTNPNNAQTISDSIDDEAVIMGVGMKEFRWKYKPGDEIGVVVQGISQDPTRHDNAWPRTVFAFMEEGCRPINLGSYLEMPRQRIVEFPVAGMGKEELEDCMNVNWFDPGDISENYDLTVDIQGPGEPVTNGQKVPISLNANALIDDKLMENADLMKKAHYTWKIYKLKAGATEGGGPPNLQNPDDFTESDWERLFTHSDIEAGNATLINDMRVKSLKGINLHEIKMLAEFPSSALTFNGNSGIIRVVVEINAPTEQVNVTRFGRGEFLMNIVSGNDSRLLVRPIDTYGGGDGSLTKVLGTDFDRVICDATSGDADSLDFQICQVIRNEVFAIQIEEAAIVETAEDFGIDRGLITPDVIEWTLDGQSITCDPRMYSECLLGRGGFKPGSPGYEPGGGYIIFLPVRQNGAIHTVTANINSPAAGATSTKKLSRTIYVKEPQMIITGCPTFGEDGSSPDFDPAFVPDCGAGTNVTAKTFGEFADPAPQVDNTSEIGPTDNTDRSVQTYQRNGDTFTLNAHFAPNMLNRYSTGSSTAPAGWEDRVTVGWQMTSAEDTPSQIGQTQDFTVPDYLSDVDVEVKARAIIQTPDDIRNLLEQHFDIFKETGTIAQYVDSEATITPPGTLNVGFITEGNYLAHLEQRRSEMTNNTFLAFIATNTPSYLIFLIKIVVSSVAILIAARSALFVAQRQN